MKNEHDKKYTKTKLKELGFTEKMIADLLPAPTLKENPVFKSQAPMKLWGEEDVIKVMDTEQFKEQLMARQKRREASKKAVETKRKALEKLLHEMIDQIVVSNIGKSDDELREIVLREKEQYDLQRYHWCSCFIEGLTIDSLTVDRWVVNYIRHNYTYYDLDLYEFKGKVGKGKAYLKYKEAVLDKISQVYPKYTAECKRQIEKMYSDFEYWSS